MNKETLKRLGELETKYAAMREALGSAPREGNDGDL